MQGLSQRLPVALAIGMVRHCLPTSWYSNNKKRQCPPWIHVCLLLPQCIKDCKVPIKMAGLPNNTQWKYSACPLSSNRVTGAWSVSSKPDAAHGWNQSWQLWELMSQYYNCWQRKLLNSAMGSLPSFWGISTHSGSELPAAGGQWICGLQIWIDWSTCPMLLSSWTGTGEDLQAIESVYCALLLNRMSNCLRTLHLSMDEIEEIYPVWVLDIARSQSSPSPYPPEFMLPMCAWRACGCHAEWTVCRFVTCLSEQIETKPSGPNTIWAPWLARCYIALTL